MTGLPEEARRSYGHYDVESVLGRGAMGMVYLARDRRIGRKVALKTVQVDQSFDDASEQTEFFKRLQREAELGGSLQHPNIVTLYEPGYENDVISFLATEYIDGDSLRQRLKKTRPLPLEDALRISEDLLRGLAFAHEKGIVHRDIKPANILLTSGGQAKIADFGIARPKESELTVKGEMLGTPNYMSPEQVKCTPVTTQSDLFSVGVVMYEMLTGAKAFAAGDLSGILRNVVELDPPPANTVNPAVPAEVARVVARLLAKQPQDRYPSANDALSELHGTPREVVVESGGGISTVSGATPPKQQTDVTPPRMMVPAIPITPDSHFGDATPLGGSSPTERASPRLYRPISPILFWAVILLSVAAFAARAWQIRENTHERPTVIIPRDKLSEFATKKRLLIAARQLSQTGKLQESIDAYNAYIDRFPNSATAYVERDEVYAALEESKKKNRSAVTVRSTKKPKVDPKPVIKEEDKKKPGFFRRIFGGRDRAPAGTSGTTGTTGTTGTQKKP